MPSLWSNHEHSITVEMSRFFLESSEHIHINPRHWRSWRRKKQQLVRRLFTGSNPLPRPLITDDLHDLTDHELNEKYNAQYAEIDAIDSANVNLFI